ncbi:MAG: NTP transferase domain-containing protein [Deltaproteobacteria bacterium]|jgi:CTP:molybdopterin cytidylyltransferase MocA|nr:NTP transferase domain-containing protein [Deltaproteobacteria bacterium]
MIDHIPVIIAAAGTGTRLGLGRPKCLVPINGTPLINYLLFLLRDFADIRLVVGFGREEVRTHVAALRSGVRFITNADFENTNTLQSLFLGAQGVEGNCLCLDGDMVIEEASFARFLAQCANGLPRIAVSEDITDDPVYAAAGRTSSGELEILAFTIEPTAHEWANVAYIPADWLAWENLHFFRRLQNYLPCSGAVLRRLEVDTGQDLAHAEGVLRGEPGFCRYLRGD